MTFSFVKNRRAWFAFSAVMIGASIVALFVYGLRLSIDFTGGSLMEMSFTDATPAPSELSQKVIDAGFESVTTQTSGDNKIILRLESLAEEDHQALLEKLKTDYPSISEDRFDSIGPAISEELRKTSFIAVAVTLLLIGLYIAWAFRKVSEPVPSWKYAILVVITAAHDVIVPLGVFAVLGHFYHWEVGTAFIAAILTILGYSISDTVVVFDRTRENLQHHGSEPFSEIVDRSIRQTFVRSVNTSVTAVLSLLAIFFWGGESTRPFALALIIGIAVGTYSSIFIASPGLVEWEHWKKK